jgi:hypothetical protein
MCRHLPSNNRRYDPNKTTKTTRKTTRKVAKFWLGEVSLAKSRGFPARELRELERIVVERQQQFLKAWNEYNSH